MKHTVKKSLIHKALLSTVAMVGLVSASNALAVTESNFTGGTAGYTVKQDTTGFFPDRINITAPDKSIGNFNQFNVPVGQQVLIYQPSQTSTTLARINDSAPSTFRGSVDCQGICFFTNPNGFVFDNSASSGTFYGNGVVSIAGISDNNFINPEVDLVTGNITYNFDIPGSPTAAIELKEGASSYYSLDVSPNGAGHKALLANGIRVNKDAFTYSDSYNAQIKFAAGKTFKVTYNADKTELKKVDIVEPLDSQAVLIDGTKMASPIEIQSGSFIYAVTYGHSNLPVDSNTNAGSIEFQAKVTKSAFKKYYDKNGNGVDDTSFAEAVDPETGNYSTDEGSSVYAQQKTELVDIQDGVYLNARYNNSPYKIGGAPKDDGDLVAIDALTISGISPIVEGFKPDRRIYINTSIVDDPIITPPTAPTSGDAVLLNDGNGNGGNGRPQNSVRDALNADNFPDYGPNFVNGGESFGSGAGNLLATGGNLGGLSPAAGGGDLGSLSPSAGGNSQTRGNNNSQNNSDAECANNYLSNQWIANNSSPCGGQGNQI